MPTNTTHILSAKKQDAKYALILLITAVCIGIYLIITTVLISKDGITFIKYAQNLQTDPIKTISGEHQHPGYPSLILAAHKIVATFETSSFWSWVYSAQIMTLIFRLFAIIALYFIGKEIVGQRFSFLAVLILIFLPNTASYGSDALSDWPHLFFLATGFLLLILAAKNGKSWLFGLTGLTAGLGYLIRPECAQLVVFSSIWLALQFLWPKRTMSRQKAIIAFTLLLVGFLLIASPYMKLKGAIFPKKNVGQFVSIVRTPEYQEEETQTFSNTPRILDFILPNITKAFGKLITNIGETLMWFFALPLSLGIYNWFRKQTWHEPQKFFITSLIFLNVPLMIWLYCKHGYMSYRHTLPLVVLTIFYIPAGLQVLAFWLERIFKNENKVVNLNFLFNCLLIIGIIICIPKLFRPLNKDKVIFLKAAVWLAQNTQEDDVIAVPDLRISFYAGRKGADYKHYAFAENAQYAVSVSKKKGKSDNKSLPKKAEILYTDESDNKYRLDIYKLFD